MKHFIAVMDHLMLYNFLLVVEDNQNSTGRSLCSETSI